MNNLYNRFSPQDSLSVVFKIFRLLMIIALVMPFMAAMTSCDDDEKENEPEQDYAAALYGAWTREISKPTDNQNSPLKTILLFDSNGKVTCTTHIPGSLDQGGGIGPGTITSVYDFEVIKNTIKLKYIRADSSYSECILLYIIDENDLTLEYISGTKLHYIFYPDLNSVTFSR